MTLNEDYMREALREAEISLKEGNIPIGCVIVRNNKIISRGHNEIYTLKDRLAHAELSALKRCKKNSMIIKERLQFTLLMNLALCV